LVVLAIVAAYLLNPSPLLGFEERDWVLVADFQHPEGEEELARALKLALTVGVQESGYVNVFSRPQIAGVLQHMQRPWDTAVDQEIGREICQRAGVKGLVAPEVMKVGDGYLLTIGLIEPASGVAAESFSARADDEDGLLDALETVMQRLRRAVGESLFAVRSDDKRLAAVTTASFEALKAYSEGLHLWNAGEYEQAVAHHEKAIELDPDFASAYAALGSAYASYIFNSRDKARENFEAALERLDRVGDREINFIQAQYAGFLDRTDEEIEFLKAHLASYPDDVGGYLNLGSTYRDLGDYTRAIESYREALRIAPRAAGAMINIATCLTSDGNPEEAVEFYRAAFEIQPGWLSSGNLNHEYGMALAQLGRYHEAGDVFHLRLNQPDASSRGYAKRSLGQLALYQGHFDQAAAHFSDAVALHLAADEPIGAGRDRLFAALGEAARGRPEEAVAALDQAALEVPVKSGWIWLRSLIGSAYLAADDIESAQQISDELTEWADSAEEPGEDPLQRRDLLEAGILVSEGNPDRALEILESLQTVGNRENAFLVASLAEAYRAAGRWPEAEQTLLQLIEIRWDYYEGLVPFVAAHYQLAQVSESLKQTEDAIGYYRRFLELWGGADTEIPEIETARQRLEALGGI
jgi:tetratricopeptide (TPR) repeat protein